MKDLKSCQGTRSLSDCVALVFATETLSREIHSLSAEFTLRATSIAVHCYEDHFKDTSTNCKQCRGIILQVALNASYTEQELPQLTQWHIDSDT